MLTLICKQVEFLSVNDETSFFEWLKRIEPIKEVNGVGDEIRLQLESDSIDDESLRELAAIFFRYGVDLTQLSKFKRNDNAEWFYGNKLAFWSKGVFGEG